MHSLPTSARRRALSLLAAGLLPALTLAHDTPKADAPATNEDGVRVDRPIDGSRPDAHAPISVMADHTHKRGEWMFSFRRMTMEMDGNRLGEQRLSPAQVLSSFMVTPLRMTMRMNMLGAMYAPSDELTLMLMIPRIELGMDHVTRTGVRFRTEAEGIGDIRLGLMHPLHKGDRKQWHVGAMLSAPTGEVEVRGPTPLGANSLLPYPMRLGAGTYGFHPSLTYNVQEDWGSAGFQIHASTWLGNNDQGYQLGDEVGIQAWAQRKLSSRTSAGVRLGWKDWDNISGADSRLNPNMIPTARADLRAGERLDLGFGFNWKLRGHRLALEYVIPLEQKLDGPQLETDRIVTLGYQYSF